MKKRQFCLKQRPSASVILHYDITLLQVCVVEPLNDSVTLIHKIAVKITLQLCGRMARLLQIRNSYCLSGIWLVNDTIDSISISA